MVDFINKFINEKYKNKLIIVDNASSHRNQLVKDVIKKNNNLLYACFISTLYKCYRRIF